MSGFRARTLSASFAIAAGLVIGLGGQTRDNSRTWIQHVGLPAIDQGVLADESHSPASVETARHAALQAALVRDRIGTTGIPYVPGRILVKFRDTASPTDRQSAMESISRTAVMTARPSYADFDVVRIDLAEDAEAAADALRKRPEVEYAQAPYRIHTMFKPNDPLYETMQWNLPMINMERAWDIQ